MAVVSIIMPIFNVEKYLKKSIESVLNQTHQNIELILVNDGSPDDSVKICKYYEKLDQRVRVIDQENAGVGYARNAGLAIASGDYIYFADSDDYIEPNLIEDNVKIAEEATADLVVFGFFEETLKADGNHTYSVKVPNLENTKTKEQFRNAFNSFYYFTPYALWNKLYKREYLKKAEIHFSKQKIGEDALFNQSVYLNLEKSAFNKKAYYHYVYREGSAVNHYLKNRFEQEYNVAQHFESLMNKWDKKNENQDLINREYWNAIYLEIKNLTSGECLMSQKEKVKRLKQIMEKQKLKEVIAVLDSEDEQNKFVKLLIMLVKNEKYDFALKLMKVRVTIGRKNQSTLAALKRYFIKNDKGS
ncbi:glycosyltransferase family 2 protein [Carnobacterium mobile]|uniref:glycosyltransferase family 2 protein n=1 Tax=Carnobacterium mobile TaxID=2750 RepID=UPI00055172AD|nr:glycosyltransferase family 2 protein [Carnobacterium mobile]